MFKFNPSDSWFKKALQSELALDFSAGSGSGASYDLLFEKVKADPDACIANLIVQLKSLGIQKSFVQKRLDFDGVLEKRTVSGNGNSITSLMNLAARSAKAFGVEALDLLFSTKPLNPVPIAAAFKKRINTNEAFLNSYTAYAFNLSRIALKAAVLPAPRIVPSDYQEMRELFLSNFDSFTLDNVANFIYDFGILIIPLKDSGAFNGACWKINGRSVIVLKQSTDFESRWMHDLWHECYHISQRQHESEFVVLENANKKDDSAEEEEANEFGANVILNGRADELTQECVQKARGSVARLKSTLPSVAFANQANLPALANYTAYRLALQNINWWGAASNLEKPGRPFEKLKGIFLERINPDLLKSEERNQLLRAVQ